MNKTIKLRPEDELILACAKTELNEINQEKIKQLLKNDLDWSYILQMVNKHKLIPLLYTQLSRLNYLTMPKSIILYLEEYFHRNIQKNLLMLGELLKILKLFNRAKITAVPYKGPLLSIIAYDNLGLRVFGDLDIYINIKDALKAKEILISEGYKPYLTLDPSVEKRFIESQVDYQFLNNSNSIILELHWNLTSLFFTTPDNEENVFLIDKKKYNVNGNKVKSFTPESLLVILCIHNSSHNWSRLLWICDIAELIKHFDINWDLVLNNSSKLGAEKIVLINLILVNRLLKLKLPKEIDLKINSNNELNLISNKIIKSLFLNTDKSFNLFDKVLMNFKIRDSIVLGIRDSIRGATTPTVYEWGKLHSSIIYPFCYIYRPIMLLIRHNLW